MRLRVIGMMLGLVFMALGARADVVNPPDLSGYATTGNLAIVSGQVAVVTGQVAVLTGQVTTATGQIAVLTGQITTVTGQVAVLTGQVAVLTGQVAGITNTYRDASLLTNSPVDIVAPITLNNAALVAGAKVTVLWTSRPLTITQTVFVADSAVTITNAFISGTNLDDTVGLVTNFYLTNAAAARATNNTTFTQPAGWLWIPWTSTLTNGTLSAIFRGHE